MSAPMENKNESNENTDKEVNKSYEDILRQKQEGNDAPKDADVRPGAMAVQPGVISKSSRQTVEQENQKMKSRSIEDKEATMSATMSATKVGAVAVGGSTWRARVSAGVTMRQSERERRKFISAADEASSSRREMTDDIGASPGSAERIEWRDRPAGGKTGQDREKSGERADTDSSRHGLESSGSSRGRSDWRERRSGGKTIRQAERERQKLEAESKSNAPPPTTCDPSTSLAIHGEKRSDESASIVTRMVDSTNHQELASAESSRDEVVFKDPSSAFISSVQNDSEDNPSFDEGGGDPIIQAHLVSEPEIVEAIVHKERNYTKQIFIATAVIAAVIGVVVVFVVFVSGDDNEFVDPGEVKATICFKTNKELVEVVDRYIDLVYNDAAVFRPDYAAQVNEIVTTYGWPVGQWCVSEVTNFTRVFSGDRNPMLIPFNEDISTWDVSRGTTFYEMFWITHEFDQPIGDWDVSSAKDLEYMFEESHKFNQDISRWNVSKVTRFTELLNEAFLFDQDLSGWDVSSAENMYLMFGRAYRFNSRLNDWDVSKVTDMEAMFYDSPFNSPLDRWEVSRVATFEGMFDNAVTFDQDISGWNVSKAEVMESMFENAVAFNGDISRWDVARVTNMENLFLDASSFNQDISGWDVGLVNNFRDMFRNASSFRQSLCEWGNDIFPRADIRDMFVDSGCFDTADPFLSPDGSVVSPLCDVCTVESLRHNSTG